MYGNISASLTPPFGSFHAGSFGLRLHLKRYEAFKPRMYCVRILSRKDSRVCPMYVSPSKIGLPSDIAFK